jgi:hypothetical protein
MLAITKEPGHFQAESDLVTARPEILCPQNLFKI